MLQAEETSQATRTSARAGKVHVNDTSVQLWEENVDERAMHIILRGVVARLRSRGFTVQRDPHVLKNYPSLAETSYVGCRGKLEVFAELRGRHLETVFFQNINVSNHNGGRYDHDKLPRMDRTMRLECVVEMASVARKLLPYGYDFGELLVDGEIKPREVLRAAEKEREANESPLERFNRKWTSHRFERDETGWPTPKEYAQYNNDRDRDGRPLRNGMVRYFRARAGEAKGRLLRGTIYTNLGNMWQVVDATGATINYVSSGELFDCERPDFDPRRRIEGQFARIERELQRAITVQRYDRVQVLAGVLGRMKSRASFFVRSTDKGLWWRENSNGYTSELASAGRFTEERARGIARSCDHVEAVHCEEAARRFR